MIAAGTPNLELTLRARPDGGGAGFLADLRLGRPDSSSDVEVAAAVPVALDLAALREVEVDARAYGQRLSQMLFGERAMSEAWSRVAGYVQGAGTGLRVRLRLDGSVDALHGVRWETLPDPATGLPLARSQRVVLSRYLDSSDLSRVELPRRPQLRALVAVASPDDLEDFNLAPLDVADELARVREALGDLPQTTLAPPPHAPRRATFNNLVSALREGCSIVYLVAHGTLARGASVLWLENDEGTCERAKGSELVQRLADLDPRSRPLLFTLASCQSAGAGQASAVLAALGPQLSRAGVAAVLGMQDNAPISMLRKLMPRFFSLLRASGEIDRALAQARDELGESEPWWMPVLFLRSRDGRLWSSEETAGAAPDAAGGVAAGGAAAGPSAIAEKLRTREVRDQLSRFRAIFAVTRDQIRQLNRYKSLHDLFQDMEIPFNVVARDRKRLATDPTAWDDAREQIEDLGDHLGRLLALLEDAALRESFELCARRIAAAQTQLAAALSGSDAAKLDGAVGQVKRVLSLDLSQANTRLVAVARELRLADVVAALRTASAELARAAPDHAALKELGSLTTTLDSLRATLEALVREHDRWQAIDNELRSAADSPGGLAEEVSLAWPMVRPQIDAVLQSAQPATGSGDPAPDWPPVLAKLAADLDAALGANDTARVPAAFRAFYRKANQRFVEVDKTLLRTCERLQQAGDTLDSVLKAIDEGT